MDGSGCPGGPQGGGTLRETGVARQAGLLTVGGALGRLEEAFVE